MPTPRVRKQPAIVIDDKNDFAQTLIKLRTARNLSQTDVAYKLSKESSKTVASTYTMLRNWERGIVRPSLGNLILLMKILGYTLTIQENE